MRPQVKRWRPRAYLSFIYLDDGLGGQPEKVSAAAASIIQRRERFTVSCTTTSWQVSTCSLLITLRVKSTLEVARRSLVKPVTLKEPLSALELVQGITSHYKSNSSLAVIRFLFALLVGYAGFLREDQI